MERLSGWPRRVASFVSADGEEGGRGPLFRWWELAGYGGLLLTAAAMRLWDLGSRAMHHDESLHAFYSWDLYRGLGFQHNPMMHGPLQFEATAGIFFVLGDSDVTSRLLYALAGTVLVMLPLLFRSKLGRVGALLVAAMLAFSPAMLYFSRFARNDILMAVWALSLVIFMWRYLDEGKNRYLYISSAILALAYSTKETAYLLTGILGLYMLLLIVPRNWAEIRRGIRVHGLSPPVALARVVSEVWAAYQRGVNLSIVSRPAVFLILLISLTLPLWSAFVGMVHDRLLMGTTKLMTIRPDNNDPRAIFDSDNPLYDPQFLDFRYEHMEVTGAIGAPAGGGYVIAFLLVVVLLGLSVYLGYRWNWSTWWRCALVFYWVWGVLYTTFLTHFGGIATGFWQSAGYWVAQQQLPTGRGAQPWYYYFVITPIYEFLPLIVGAIAVVYYLRRGDGFGRFLAYWALITFFLYTVANEKMPWLLVNVALPLIVLSGRFLVDVLQRVEWRRIIPSGAVLALPGVPALLWLLWSLAFFETGSSRAANIAIPAALGAVSLGLVAVGVYLARRSGARNFAAFALVPLVLLLVVLTIRTGVQAAYKNGDVPVEMIVYTQTSPDIPRYLEEIERSDDASTEQDYAPITIDPTSGFSWPWAWYLRDRPQVNYTFNSSSPLEQASNTSVVVVHSNNQSEADAELSPAYAEAERIKHRWWFPENSTYKHITLGEFMSALVDRESWRRAMDYFLYRRGIEERIGSEDSYIYFARDLQ